MSEWITPMKNFQHTGFSPSIIEMPLGLNWKRSFNDYFLASPVINNGIVYVPLPGTGFTALNLTDGETVWIDPGYQKAGSVSASYFDGIVFACAREGLFAYSAEDGEKIWSVPSNCGHSTPGVHDGTVYWGTLDNELWAADIASGDLKWKVDIYPAGNLAPSFDGQSIYVSCGKSVLALDPDTGKQIWQWSTDAKHAAASGWITILEDILLAPISNYGVVCLNREKGEFIWRNHGSTGISVSMSDRIGYVASSELRAISIDLGEELWSTSYAFSQSAPIAIGDHVIIGGGNRRAIYAFNRVSGQLVWEFETGDLVYSTPSFSNGRLLIGSHDGYLYCFEMDE